jgi:hypothetical protein
MAKKLSRREFLKAGALGVAGTFGIAAAGQLAGSKPVRGHHLGGDHPHGDGPHGMNTGLLRLTK